MYKRNRGVSLPLQHSSKNASKYPIYIAGQETNIYIYIYKIPSYSAEISA